MSKEFRHVGFDYDMHIYDELGKRISSTSGQTKTPTFAIEKAGKEFMDTPYAQTMTLTISKVIEVKE